MSTFTEEVQLLPAQPISALRVLAMVDDPDASTADLARLVETDPILSLHVMRLANSSYYGLGGTVASAGRAVVLLGFTTVRALAVTAVCALLDDRSSAREGFAAGYWPHAVATAFGASVVARRVHVPAGDAFSAGLLHDIGAALMHRREPQRYANMVDRAAGDRSALLAAERRWFGTTHPDVGAEVLAAWGLPPGFVRAVQGHHRPIREAQGSLSKVVVAGEALAQRLDDTLPYEPAVDVAEALAAVGLARVGARELLDEMRTEIGALGRFLEIAA